MFIALTIGLFQSGAGAHHQPAADNPAPDLHPLIERCPSASNALRHYRASYSSWLAKRGVRVEFAAKPSACPRYLLHLTIRKARLARQQYEVWFDGQALRDYEVEAENHAWHKAVEQAQRPYPGTKWWLLSCSASEGGHGRWVPNSQGSGVGGWLQFMPGTFWRMFTAAKADVRERGYRVPPSAASWYSPLGQALAGAWGVTNGRRHEWAGGGC